jgi:murein DD-endopeptidase MepM/ murein hydrolase activator NlpD
VLLFFAAALVTLAVFGWGQFAGGFLERGRPEITLVENVRGIGVAPVSIKIHLTDTAAGLDEVVVRTRQKRQVKEILRRSLNGQKRGEISIDFQGDKSGFEEGGAALEVRAFDRSFWSNQAELVIPLKVDYRRPRVEVVSSQHNAREGGSQLVFYRAEDENLALSGVKVGNQTFVGFPARGIDSEFEDSTLYVAIYGIEPGKKVESSAVRVFAEDDVGNAAAAPFYNKIQPRSPAREEIEVTDDFLRGVVVPIVDANLAKIEDSARVSGEQLSLGGETGSIERQLEKFRLANENLRAINEREILGLLKEPRFERYWNGAFSIPHGGFRARFGETLQYNRGGGSIGKAPSVGYEVISSVDDAEIGAANDGIVVFAGALGVYGQTVILDHGLGLAALYCGLGSTKVRQGESVTAGQVLGTAGRSGLARGPGYLLQMRLSGTPIDALEWWDRGWYEAHIAGKINDIKQVLGIRSLRPLGKRF